MTSDLIGIMAPRCDLCGHYVANHHGTRGCTSIKAHTDDSDPLPCGCGGIKPLKGLCRVCGDILHDGDATCCDLCRGTRYDPEPAE